MCRLVIDDQETIRSDHTQSAQRLAVAGWSLAPYRPHGRYDSAVPMTDNEAIAGAIARANEIAEGGAPVIVDVHIDYSRKTAFTLGAVKTNFGRFPLNEKLRFLTRAGVRHIVG